MANVFDLMDSILGLISDLQILFWAAAVFLFVFGMVKFMANSDDSEAHEAGKHLMIWGIITFFVLVSIWGIVYFVLNSTGVTPVNMLDFIDRTGTVH